MGSGTEVVVCPFESGVGGDVQGDVKVAVWSTVGALSAFACQFDALSVGDSCRDGDAEFAVEHLDDVLMRGCCLLERELEFGFEVLSAYALLSSA